MKKTSTRFIAILLMAVLIFLSEVPLANHFTKETGFKHTAEVLDRQEFRLTAMTMGAVTASTAIALAPGDTTSPVANELADMISTFTFALAAVFLERFLMTKLCWLSLRILIPAALVLLILFLATFNRCFFQAGKKLLLLGVVLTLIIPAGALFSSSMEAMFQEQLNAAMGVTDEVNDAQAEETLSEEEARAELDAASKREFSWQDTLNFFTSLPGTVTGAIKDIPDSLSSGISHLMEQAQLWIHALMTGLAVMLVGTVAIPLGTLMLGLKVVGIVAGIETNPTALLSAPRKIRKKVTDESEN